MAESALAQAARRRSPVWIGLGLAGTLALGAAAVPALLTLLLGPPLPRVHDEFSNLLLADTLAHGRLANPTHPLWERFESFHIIQHPTYASKYPPGQGAILALGRRLAGHPIVGVWMTLAIAALAMYWMLCAWLPRSWAFLGAALTYLQPGVLTWWGDSYWGGALAALGGALVYGGAGRLWREPCVRDALAVGAGLVVLALSRPFEGLLVSLPVAVLLSVRWIRAGRAGEGLRFAGRVALPLALCGTAGLAFLGFYNRAVTGKPWLMPYALHESTYTYVPLFCWGERTTPPEYRHDVLRRFNASHAAATYHLACEAAGWWRFKLTLVDSSVVRFYLGSILWLPAGIALVSRRREAWLLAAGCVSVLAGNLVSAWILPHYFAPATACLGGLTAFGLRRLASLEPRWRLGLATTAGVVALALGASAVEVGEYVAGGGGHGRAGFASARQGIDTELRHLPGRDLVIVRYGPQHNVHEEWVYNDADIDGAPVVWARAMDAARDLELLKYFGDRCTWDLAPDERPRTLKPYTLAGQGRDCSP